VVLNLNRTWLLNIGTLSVCQRFRPDVDLQRYGLRPERTAGHFCRGIRAAKNQGHGEAEPGSARRPSWLIFFLHDPEFRSRVRRDDLFEVGQAPFASRTILSRFTRYSTSGLTDSTLIFTCSRQRRGGDPIGVGGASCRRTISLALSSSTKASGEIESLVRATAGYGKVTRLEQLEEHLDSGRPRGLTLATAVPTFTSCCK